MKQIMLVPKWTSRVTWKVVTIIYICAGLVRGLSTTSSNTAARQLELSAESSGVASSLKTIVAPNQPFRVTEPGEVSIVSFNALAPSLHGLCQPLTIRKEYERKDREERVPVALQTAKRLNGDVLCLQEVEGGPDHEIALERMLSSSDAINGDGVYAKGYDSYVWSPLHPHRPGEVVGLCVAWRSDRHTLISSSKFRRGLVVQLQEKESGACFSIGNLHLPARPSDIFGRLKAVATACRRIEDNRVASSSKHLPLDGAAIMVGDFNCDTSSSPVHLLKHGLVSPGILFERNYRHKLTRTNAYKLRHGLRFLDAYGDALRKSVASMTVSLHGRGPGSMDHVLYSPGKWGKTRKRASPALNADDLILASALGGKRSRRRHRVKQRKMTRADSEPSALLRAEAVLATIDPNDTKRTTLIASGLPRLEEGFASDHLPVGVLLSPAVVPKETPSTEKAMQERPVVTPGGDAIKRGDAHTTRQRHNALVRAMTAWLMQRGAIDFIKDEPLYKWKWVDGVNHVKRKMRAPDICCVAPLNNSQGSSNEGGNESESVRGGALVMVEVTVANRPHVVRKQKQAKYEDLPHMLSSTTSILEAELSVLSPFVIVVSDTGELPLKTMETLESLVRLTRGPDLDSDESAASIGDELLRIRNHWTPTEAA